MAALFNSLIRALGGVAVSMAVVALVWMIYINRGSLAEIAAPVVTPLVDSVAGNEPPPSGNADREAVKEPMK